MVTRYQEVAQTDDGLSSKASDGPTVVENGVDTRTNHSFQCSHFPQNEEHIFGLITPHYGRLRFASVFDEQEFLRLTRNCGLPPLWCCWHQGTTSRWPHSVEALPVVTKGIWHHLNTAQTVSLQDEAMEQPQDPRPLLASYAQYYHAKKELRVTPCTITEANQYIKDFHRHSAPVHAALFAVQVTDGVGIVRGVALVAKPVARHLDVGKEGRMKRRIAEVVRVATDTTWNVSSLLYGAVRRICKVMGFETLITYTLKEESGASLRAAGWVCVKETGGNQWNNASRPRHIKAIYNKQKYRWQCELNPPFPFETISRPCGLGEAMPFACHHFLPEAAQPTLETREQWEARWAEIDAMLASLAVFETPAT